MEFISVLQEFGPLAGVVLWFIWRDWQREDRLTSRIEKLEDEQRSILWPLIEKATTVIAQNTEVMERLESSLTRVSSNANQSQS